MEGSDHDLILGTISAFAWRYWGQPRKSLVTTANLRAKIWNQDLPNTKLEC
jgi:hypothetical protein